MIKKLLALTVLVSSLHLSGCASVPMSSPETDKAKKTFAPPAEGKAGLYVYRNSSFGGALKKTITIDGAILGESAPNTYFYKELSPGTHLLSTESEFSDNALSVNLEAGSNYYVHQYIRLGAFVGGAALEMVSEAEGKKGVLECKLAQENPNLSPTK